jgi:hypothetical protein
LSIFRYMLHLHRHFEDFEVSGTGINHSRERREKYKVNTAVPRIVQQLQIVEGFFVSAASSCTVVSTIEMRSRHSIAKRNYRAIEHCGGICRYMWIVWMMDQVRWVPCYYGMARPLVANGGDGLQIWRVAANILNKQSRSADKGWSSSLGVGRGAYNSSPQKIKLLRKFTRSLGRGLILWIMDFSKGK